MDEDDTPFGLWPTPNGHDPGIDADRLVDKDGNPPMHWNQRLYDKFTGRLVQKGLPQAAAIWERTRRERTS